MQDTHSKPFQETFKRHPIERAFKRHPIERAAQSKDAHSYLPGQVLTYGQEKEKADFCRLDGFAIGWAKSTKGNLTASVQ
ncbi:hypothetical protein [Pseudoalteromonas rubra]|uniref:hypothetical protein n=1 Tax=Pseudoalteromonas rubra TaxID=43658 RepID=UPI000F7827DF|nr:hypothetical protein [Pseudoalteromonas rubra]